MDNKKVLFVSQEITPYLGEIGDFQNQSLFTAGDSGEGKRDQNFYAQVWRNKREEKPVT